MKEDGSVVVGIPGALQLPGRNMLAMIIAYKHDGFYFDKMTTCDNHYLSIIYQAGVTH